jgi:hypothetical protein
LAGGAPRWTGDRRRRASGFFLPMEVRPHLRQGFNNLSKKALSNIRRALMVRVVSHLFWKIFGLEDGPVRRIIAGWQAIYGPPNILAVPIAGCLTRRQRRSIQTSILEASAVTFAASRSTHGLAFMIFSIGRSIRWSHPCLGKGGVD